MVREGECRDDAIRMEWVALMGNEAVALKTKAWTLVVTNRRHR